MSAIRVARGVKGRDKIIKFDGCYHGHADSFLIGAGSGVLTFGLPNSPGVTAGAAQDTLLARFNDIDSVEAIAQQNPGQIAAVIIEPICGNTGCIPPDNDFLTDLRSLCDAHDICLIFDEVMTGFRVARGGAAQVYGITPDLYCFGKVVGGGFPLAAYGGKREYMSQVAPAGPIYQAGTLSGNPVAVRAGLTTLRLLDDAAYATLEALGAQLQRGMDRIIQSKGYPVYQHRVGSMFGLFFHPGPVRTHDDVKQCDIKRFNAFFHAMLKRGVYLAPSQFEAGFLSTAHTPDMIDQVLHHAEASFAEVF
jgi:glutamate-1-semialdehyde 2,1-aminomutase